MQRQLLKRSISKMLRKIDVTYMPLMPSTAMLELCRICNCHCRTCNRSVMDIDKIDMSDELIQKVVAQVLPVIYQLDVTGLGEAMCSRHFWYLIDECARRKIQVTLFSNGILVNDQAADRLGQAGAKITLSIDGRTEKTLDLIRPGIKTETMDKAMSALLKSRNKHGLKTHFKWSVHTVMTRSNLNELSDIIEWAASYGCRLFTFSEFDIFGRSDPFAEESLVNEPERYHHVFPELEKTAVKYNADLILPAGIAGSKQSGEHGQNFGKKPGKYFQKCYSPWRECNILANGDVFACCILGPEPLGNLSTDSFRTIWNNERYQKFRKTIHSGNPPVQCRHCAKEWGITGGNTRYFDNFSNHNK